MGKFSENLDLRQKFVDQDYVWALLSPLEYIANDGTIYTIPEGFVTDLASIPRVCWPILAPFWRYAKASVLHDYLLEQGYDPVVATKIFREAMLSSEVNKVQVFTIYWAVRTYFAFKPLFLRVRDIYKAWTSKCTRPKS